MAIVLVIGSGGREHAICWKLAQSEEVWLLRFYVTLCLLFLYRVFMLCSSCWCHFLPLSVVIVGSQLSGLHNYDEQANSPMGFGSWWLSAEITVAAWHTQCSRVFEKLIFVQEMGQILWKLKVQYCVHNSPPLNPILSQMRPIHSLTSCFCNTYCSCFDICLCV